MQLPGSLKMAADIQQRDFASRVRYTLCFGRTSQTAGDAAGAISLSEHYNEACGNAPSGCASCGELLSGPLLLAHNTDADR